MRAVELFLQTLQTGGDLATQLEATLNQQRSVPPVTVSGPATDAACNMCAKAAEELKRERQSRIDLEKQCASQQRRIVELEKMLVAVDR